MALVPILDELKDFKKIEKVLTSAKSLFKNIAIMHGKSEYSNIKRSIWNISIEAANICNILSRPAVSNGLIAIKLKCDLKCRGHVHFKQVLPHIIYQALSCFK